MTAPTLTIGTRIDVVPSNLWHSRNISPGALRTIQDLLTALQSDTQISMLRTTAGHVAACLSQRLDQLAIDVLVDVAPQFTAYLMARHHKRNAVRSYRNYANMLVRKAKELGWEPSKSVVPAEWDAVCRALRRFPGLNKILRYAIRNGRHPSQFCDRDLDAWQEEMLKSQRSYDYVRHATAHFRRAITQTQLAEQLPNITCRQGTKFRYGVSLQLFPAALRNEVQSLLDWKQAPYEEERPPEAKLRKVTAKHLEGIITRLYVSSDMLGQHSRTLQSQP